MRNLKFLFFLYFFAIAKSFGQTPEEELARIVESYKLPLEFRWYNPQKEYVQILTNSDQIYRLPASKILEKAKDFYGKNIEYFHLMHKGREIPIYFVSQDELFDETDTLVFVGSRPRGDTTWFDSFEQSEFFFFYYDENYSSKKFEPISFSSDKQNVINSISRSLHFEEHHQYSIGVPEFSSQTMNGEGWVWELLSPSDDYIKQSNLKFSKILYPTTQADSVGFRFFAFSSKFDSVKTMHNLAILINQDTAFKGSFPPGKNIIIDFKYPSNKLKFGVNDFEVVNLGNYSSNGQLIIPDAVGFQYFEYSGMDIPFSQNGFISFPVDSSFAFSSLVLHNFKSTEVILFDTLNQGFAKIRGFPSVAFAVNVSKQNIFVSFGDSTFQDNRKGLHCFVYDSLEKVIKYWYYPENSKKIVNDLKNIAFNSIYLVVFNGERIENEVIDFFINEGSTEVSKSRSNQNWVFSRKKGEAKKFEIASSEVNTKLYGYFKANYSRTCSVTINFSDVVKQGFLYVADNQSIPFAQVNSVEVSNLFSDTNQADVIVIAPQIFADVARKYIEYRKQTYPEYNFYLALSEDIYKEFNFGKKSPDAIKRFLVWAYYKWKMPRFKFVTLLGDASFDTRNVLPYSVYKDFVPAFGWPPTDYWYCLLEGKDFVPDVHIGRIPIKTIEEGYSYIEKIQEYDNALTSPWMKKFLFLSGGTNPVERDYFYDRLKGEFADYLLAYSPICVQTQVIRKSDEVVGSEADASFIRSAINDGVQMMFFAGHGSAKVFDTDGWKVQTLNNKGKYGFFGSFSCNTANFAEPTLICRNEEYTIYPEKGFVATIGSGGVSIRLYSLLLAENLLKIIADSTIKTDNFLELFDLAKSRQISASQGFFNILTMYHYVYLGDPLLKMRIRRQPDLYFLDNKVSITNESGRTTITQNDSLFIIRGVIGNSGFASKESFNLVLNHQFNGKTIPEDLRIRRFNEACSLIEFEFRIPVRQQIGIHRFQLIIDPEHRINDYDFANNSLNYEIYVYSSSLFPVEPQANWDVNVTNPLFRFIDPYFNEKQQNYSFKIYTEPDTNSNLIYSSRNEEIQKSKIKIDWLPSFNFPTGHFWLYARKLSNDTNFQNQTLWIPFHFENSSVIPFTTLSYKEQSEFANFELKNIFFDTLSNALRLEPYKIPYKIMEASGNERSEKGKEITVNNKVYVTMAPDLDIVGFHVVIISHENFSLKEYRIFETWGTDPPEKDSSSIKLVQYLRDSVPDGDYIFLVAHSSSLRVPIMHKLYVPNSPGSLDTLKSALREWGSVFADSLGSQGYWGNSFFFVGRNFFGKKVAIDEGFDLDGDTVQSEGFLIQNPREARIQIPLLGPAKKWNQLKMNFEAPQDSINLVVSIYGIKSLLDKDKILLLKSSNLSEIALNSINALEYPYLSIEVMISNPYESSNFVWKDVSIDFIPSPELALEIVEPNLPADSLILRGEEIGYLLRIHNLSNRTSSDSTFVTSVLKTQSQTQELSTFVWGAIPPNSFKEINGNLVTDKFDTKNIIEFSCLQPNSESYAFNNRDILSVNLFEDNVRPEIVLYLDGMKIYGKEYVTKKPQVLIEIYDNSKLTFDSNSTTLLINTKKINLGERAKFTNYGRNIPLKCSYSLDSDELEYGLNYFTIYTTDPTGNKDTLDVPVYVSRLAKIDSCVVAPNPVSNDATFLIRYLSPKGGGLAKIDIFDVSGKKIRTLTKNINLNDDYIYWDGFDDNGHSIPQGVYFFSVNVSGEIYSDPVFGKLIKLKY